MTDEIHLDVSKYGAAIPISGELAAIPTRGERTLMDMVFNPTPEEIEARRANDTDDIAPAKGFEARRYVLKEPKGYQALKFTGDNIAEMKAFIGEGEGYHGRKVKKNHVDLALDYYDRDGMADIGDYVVHDLDSDEWWAMDDAEWFEAHYVQVAE
jgi:hypothetical protein